MVRTWMCTLTSWSGWKHKPIAESVTSEHVRGLFWGAPKATLTPELKGERWRPADVLSFNFSSFGEIWRAATLTMTDVSVSSVRGCDEDACWRFCKDPTDHRPSFRACASPCYLQPPNPPTPSGAMTLKYNPETQPLCWLSVRNWRSTNGVKPRDSAVCVPDVFQKPLSHVTLTCRVLMIRFKDHAINILWFFFFPCQSTIFSERQRSILKFYPLKVSNFS